MSRAVGCAADGETGGKRDGLGADIVGGPCGDGIDAGRGDSRGT